MTIITGWAQATKDNLSQLPFEPICQWINEVAWILMLTTEDFINISSNISTTQSFWPMMVLWSHVLMSRSLFCLYLLCLMLINWSIAGGDNTPKNVLMCQYRKRRTCPASAGQNKIMQGVKICKMFYQREVFAAPFTNPQKELKRVKTFPSHCNILQYCWKRDCLARSTITDFILESKRSIVGLGIHAICVF